MKPDISLATYTGHFNLLTTAARKLNDSMTGVEKTDWTRANRRDTESSVAGEMPCEQAGRNVKARQFGTDV